MLLFRRNKGRVMSNGNNKLIRNSTAEFLIFTGHAGEQSIEARNDGKTVLRTGKKWRLE